MLCCNSNYEFMIIRFLAGCRVSVSDTFCRKNTSRPRPVDYSSARAWTRELSVILVADEFLRAIDNSWKNIQARPRMQLIILERILDQANGATDVGEVRYPICTTIINQEHRNLCLHFYIYFSDMHQCHGQPSTSVLRIWMYSPKNTFIICHSGGQLKSHDLISVFLWPTPPN